MHRANVATVRIAGLTIFSLLLFGCGGGGGGTPAAPPPVLGTDASFASLSVSGVTLDPAFSPAVTDYTATVPFGSNSVDVTATTSDGNASFTINGNNAATVTLATGDNTIAIVVTAENGTTTRTYTVVVTRLSFAQEAYIKASNTNSVDLFTGRDSVALSGDGNTLAVGAELEDSAATGVNGDQANNSARGAGAVYIFRRDSGGGAWTQQAYIKASNTDAGDAFGRSVALSDDGNTLVVGAAEVLVGAGGEASAATGVNGDQTDNSADSSGAVYVFTRDTGGVWTQQAYVKASNTDAGDIFGWSVTLSGDGNTLAVGAPSEDSAATGVNGDQANNSAPSAGAVYVFARDTGGVWTQQAYVKASNTGRDSFGISLALSGDGNTLAVGAAGEDSAATGVNGDQANNSADSAGAVYVFTRDTGGVWTQQAYVKASNTDAGDDFGWDVGLSGDGNTLAVGADLEDSAVTGVNGDQTDNSAASAGAVYVFTREPGGAWTQQAYVKASNTDAVDDFGESVALSGDGTMLAVGASREDSTATGVNGDQADNFADGAGAVYVFTRDSAGTWTQQAYVKASNTDAGDSFSTVALSADGNMLAVGAGAEDSATIGVNGNQADNGADRAGAVYVFRSPLLPPGSDASFSSLSISGGTLDPVFDPAVTNYTVDVPFGSTSIDITAVTSDGNASFMVNGSSNAVVELALGDNSITIVVTSANGTITRTYTIVVTRLNLAQEAYIKASNTDVGDEFGYPVALSADGNTLAVGALYEDSAATGVNGDQADNSAGAAGAVYVFTRDTGGAWAQQAYVKASNTDAGDFFGDSVALSDDGNTLAVGAPSEDGAATGVNGDQANNSASGGGAVYVFTRDSADVWTQQAYVKASNTDAGDSFGFPVALSDDGNTLAVGAFDEDSAATGVNGNQADNSAVDAGAVYLFTRDGSGVWTQHAYIKASNTDAHDMFGFPVALSDDGNTLAVGAVLEDSAATGVNGDQTNNSAGNAGAVYVFTRGSADVWSQQAYVKASNTDVFDFFGGSATLSDDGNMLAVGAELESSAATGVNGDQADNSADGAGAVYVFTRDTGGVWTQQAYVKASNTDVFDLFGIHVTLSGDGNALAVGATSEGSAATGVNGDQADNSAGGAGAVYVFTRDTGGAWTQRAYVKASNTDAGDIFGVYPSVSDNSDALAVGAPFEGSAATGVNGDQTDNSATDAGAVYVFR